MEHFEGLKLSPDVPHLTTPVIQAPAQSLSNTNRREDSQTSDFLAHQDESCGTLLNQLSTFKSTSSFLKSRIAMDKHLSLKHQISHLEEQLKIAVL